MTAILGKNDNHIYNRVGSYRELECIKKSVSAAAIEKLEHHVEQILSDADAEGKKEMKSGANDESLNDDSPQDRCIDKVQNKQMDQSSSNEQRIDETPFGDKETVMNAETTYHDEKAITGNEVVKKEDREITNRLQWNDGTAVLNYGDGVANAKEHNITEEELISAPVLFYQGAIESMDVVHSSNDSDSDEVDSAETMKILYLENDVANVDRDVENKEGITGDEEGNQEECDSTDVQASNDTDSAGSNSSEVNCRIKDVTIMSDMSDENEEEDSYNEALSQKNWRNTMKQKSYNIKKSVGESMNKTPFGRQTKPVKTYSKMSNDIRLGGQSNAKKSSRSTSQNPLPPLLKRKGNYETSDIKSSRAPARFIETNKSTISVANKKIHEKHGQKVTKDKNEALKRKSRPCYEEPKTRSSNGDAVVKERKQPVARQLMKDRDIYDFNRHNEKYLHERRERAKERRLPVEKSVQHKIFKSRNETRSSSGKDEANNRHVRDNLFSSRKNKESEGKSPAKSPGKSPAKFPGKSPVKSPGKSPAKFPGKSPEKSPGKSPGKSPEKSPGKSRGTENATLSWNYDKDKKRKMNSEFDTMIMNHRRQIKALKNLKKLLNDTDDDEECRSEILENILLEDDTEAEVEISPGWQVKNDIVFQAGTARSMNRRLSILMKTMWSEEERDQLVLKRRRSGKNGDERRQITEEELKRLKGACITLQSIKRLDVNEVVTMSNLKVAISRTLKNDRYEKRRREKRNVAIQRRGNEATAHENLNNSDPDGDDDSNEEWDDNKNNSYDGVSDNEDSNDDGVTDNDYDMDASD